MIGQVITLMGALLMLLAANGVMRFQDPLARMHALTKASMLGVSLILIGVAIGLNDARSIAAVILAGLLHWLAAPAFSNMVSRATYLAREQAFPNSIIDEGALPLGLPAPGTGGDGDTAADAADEP